MVGPLDQGFWPDGIYTAPTDEALRYDIEITKKLGFNCARKHVKVEPDRWYYWCDKLGLLVWQDMPSGGAGDHRTDKRRSDAAATQFEAELKAMLDSFRNHPSIVMWVVFNEGWGQYDTPRLTEWVKQYDPSRLVNNASGWTDRKCGDVIDMHNYPGPGSPKPEETRAAVLGEFGGLGLTVPDHTWAGKGWGYRGSADPARLTRDYARLLRRLHALRTDAGLCAGIYTQTTDVEMEHNGLLTYDRAIVKPDLAIVAAAAARGEAPPDPVEVTVVATSEREAQTWRYSEQLADGWFQPGFDDKSWRVGPGGFGTRGTPGSVVRTEWKGKDLWLRRTFTLDKVGWRDLQLRLHHDEDAEVYLNGVLACKVEGYTSEYGLFLLGKEALAALKTGANTLAVHVKQTMGGQYIDVGLVDVVPPK
jgi:hypothetical protein